MLREKRIATLTVSLVCLVFVILVSSAGAGSYDEDGRYSPDATLEVPNTNPISNGFVYDLRHLKLRLTTVIEIVEFKHRWALDGGLGDDFACLDISYRHTDLIEIKSAVFVGYAFDTSKFWLGVGLLIIKW